MSGAFYTFYCHPHTSQDTTQFYASTLGDPASVVKTLQSALELAQSEPSLAHEPLDVLFARTVPDATPVAEYQHIHCPYYYVYTAPIKGDIQDGFLDAYIGLNNGDDNDRECIFSGTLAEFFQRCQHLQVIAATA